MVIFCQKIWLVQVSASYPICMLRYGRVGWQHYPPNCFRYNEKQAARGVNVFGYEDETSCRTYTSKQTFEKHVNLLLLSNSKNSHCVLIKDFNRIMANKTKHHGKKNFCRFCCQCFSSSRVLECYVKNFLASNHTKSDLLAAKVVYVNF